MSYLYWKSDCGRYQLWCGDNREVIPKLETKFTACVTDPPGGIGFMGKSWDHDKGGRHQWVAWMAERFKVIGDSLRPGARVLCWAIPRTSHWTGWALEDAGLELTDRVSHLFGSGFPKSHNISVAIDKQAGAERVDLGESPNWRESKRNREAVGKMEVRGENAGRVTASATEAAKLWDGHGTALKPAVEDYWLAMKPLDDERWILELTPKLLDELEAIERSHA